MKHFFLLLLLCCSGAVGFSQGRTLTVKNGTPCWVYYRVLTGLPSTCTVSMPSGVIALAPWGTVTYNTSFDIPGFPPAPLYHVLGAVVYSGPVGCTLSPAVWQLGEPCTGFPLATTAYTIDPSCTNICMQNRVTWTPANPPFVGGHAYLVFTP